MPKPLAAVLRVQIGPREGERVVRLLDVPAAGHAEHDALNGQHVMPLDVPLVGSLGKVEVVFIVLANDLQHGGDIGARQRPKLDSLRQGVLEFMIRLARLPRHGPRGEPRSAPRGRRQTCAAGTPSRGRDHPRTARKQVDAGAIELGPGMNGQVRFGNHDDSRQAVRAERMKLGAHNRGADQPGRVFHMPLQLAGLGRQVAAIVKLEQKCRPNRLSGNR